jgi:hypothetical protein
LSDGYGAGRTDDETSLPFLLGLHRGRETSMAKPRPLKVSDETRFTVLSRNGYKCEKCGSDFLWGVSVHHRRPRMMGGSSNPQLHLSANLIALCGSGTTGCHGWVESHRTESRELGYLIQKVESAELIPFRDDTGIWWHIYNDGTKTRLDTLRGTSDA